MMAAHVFTNPTLLCICILSFAYLQFRYYDSAAFDRNIHFSVTTLAIAGAAFFSFARGISKSGSRDGLADRLRFCTQSRVWSLVACVVARVFLNWRVTCTVHCSWDGLYAFLPFLLVLCDHADARPIIHLGPSDEDPPHRAPVVRNAGLALLWGVATSDVLLPAGNTTGAICPVGMYIERFVPLAQLVVLFLDAVIITSVGRLRQVNQDQSAFVCLYFGVVSWASAALLTFTTIWAHFDTTNAKWNVLLSPLEGRDIAVDGTVAALGLVSGLALLSSFHTHLVSVAAAVIVILPFVVSKPLGWVLAVVFSLFGAIGIAVIASLAFAAVFHLCTSSTATGASLHPELALTRSRYYACISAAILVIICRATFVNRQGDLPLSPERTMVTGQQESDSWVAAARKSTSLAAAVAGYRARYGIPPPPNFDVWYEYATSVNSPIIDTFDQINTDLLPFWGMSPALIREATTHLLEHPALSIGGLIVQDGKTSISPLVRGTHRWMMDSVEEMVKPFSQYLPNMHLAFNLDDECRVAVPAEAMNKLRDEAQAARLLAKSNPDPVQFSQSTNPPWGTSFLEVDEGDESVWNVWPESFHQWSKKPIYSQLISPTCPAEAPVRNRQWWNRKARCDTCASPHMQGGFVHDWNLSGDLCHQPDLAHLHGFLQSPGALRASQSLFPVFSQGKVQNFADILYPSPWNFIDKAPYEEEKDVPWQEKHNDIYWRGTSSDGYAVRGSWQTFLRARFVHLTSKARKAINGRDMFRYMINRGTHKDEGALERETTGAASRQEVVPNEPLTANISFVGNFNRCEERECLSEKVTFYGSADAEPPESVDFQECWQHRHLVDLDGAGFSGRFLPFVQSSSLPYRAALFRTWWEERIHPWKHYVPLDLRLDDFWDVVNYFGGVGAKDGEAIAQAGKTWANQALRKEDMQVYLFRLLLEWGRLIDDSRESLGFSFEYQP
ncbi:glycosyltransferase family 90 protein [Poronia punctata]|nr:glycosyltransferase family 90 protein [Poronia punctata]